MTAKTKLIDGTVVEVEVIGRSTQLRFTHRSYNYQNYDKDKGYKVVDLSKGNAGWYDLRFGKSILQRHESRLEFLK